MGAWGAGSFENDAALDWLGELRDGRTTLDQALRYVVDAGDDYVEVDEASAALAAGELIAAAHSGRHDRLSEGARTWLVAHTQAAAGADRALALRAAQRVFERSEVRELWDEHGAESEWHRGVQGLIRRLSADAEPTVASSPPPPPQRPGPAKPSATKKRAPAAKKPATKKKPAAKKKPIARKKPAAKKKPVAKKRRAGAKAKKRR